MKLYFEYLDQLNESEQKSIKEEIDHRDESAIQNLTKAVYDALVGALNEDETLEDLRRRIKLIISTVKRLLNIVSDESFVESLNEEISVGLEDSLRKYIKKFLKSNAKEIEYEVDNRGWEKAADDLVREFSIMIDDYFEAIADYGAEDIEEVEVVEEEN